MENIDILIYDNTSLTHIIELEKTDRECKYCFTLYIDPVISVYLSDRRWNYYGTTDKRTCANPYFQHTIYATAVRNFLKFAQFSFHRIETIKKTFKKCGISNGVDDGTEADLKTVTTIRRIKVVVPRGEKMNRMLMVRHVAIIQWVLFHTINTSRSVYNYFFVLS